jgi:hypothetical protein
VLLFVAAAIGENIESLAERDIELVHASRFRRGGRPPLAYLAFVDVPHPDRLPTGLPRVARARISDSFDFLDPRGESNVRRRMRQASARSRARTRALLLGRGGRGAARLKLFSELDVRSRAEARQLLIVLLAGACVECLTTVEDDGFEFPKLVRRILAATAALREPEPPLEAVPDSFSLSFSCHHPARRGAGSRDLYRRPRTLAARERFNIFSRRRK